MSSALMACGHDDDKKNGGPSPTAHSPSAPAARPPSSEESWRAFLKGWATPVGTEIDSATGYPKRVRRTGDGGEMVLIPAGNFQMGAVPIDARAYANEKPRHSVTLSRAYYMDAAEVTVAQWKRYVSEGGGPSLTFRSGTTDAMPVHNVDWSEATAFSKWAGVALPTEAQWERAATGGHDDYVYPWGGTDDVKKRNGSGKKDGFDELAPTKSFAPNDYGLYDMSGNVREWCGDYYAQDYYAKSPSTDPSGPISGLSRVLRGGGWDYYDVVDLRSSHRDEGDSPALRGDDYGFRCARSLPGPTPETIEPPVAPPSVPDAPWRSFLKDWAEPVGTEIDSVTRYPSRVRRTRDAGEMALIPAGTFQMGAVPGDDYAHANEKPRHAVTLSHAYYMDVTEVTVAQWKRYVSGGGGRSFVIQDATDDAVPVHNVVWNEATAFSKWAGVALPTEAQWERAAKGGHDDYVYPWGASDDEKRRNGFGKEDGFDQLAPPKSFAPNDYGLYDMSGNVWEWCADYYDKGYYANSPSTDPAGPASDSSRVLRGGGWNVGSVNLRSSYRDDFDATYRYGYFGFRCARSLPGP